MKEQAHKQTCRKRRFPWIRIFMACVYLGLGIALTVYEIIAHKILSKGQLAEAAQRYQTAGLAYMMVIEKFPLSFGIVEAKTGLDRIEPALEDSPLPDRLSISWIERDWGEEFNPYFMDWLPFFSSIFCSILLLFVFITRIRRGGIAVLAFLLFCIAAFFAVVQLTQYGWIDQNELQKITDAVSAERMAIYIGSYFLIVLTTLLTLTRMTKSVNVNNSLSKEQESIQKKTPPLTSPAIYTKTNVNTSPQSTVSTNNMLDITLRLRKVQELYDQDLISQDEMQKQRQRIISQL